MSSAVPHALPLGPQSLAYCVNMEPAPFLGGGRALILQVAHPLVAAGVEQHSTYESDPWGRLFRTLDVMLKLAFGDLDVSEQQARRLEAMHRRVQGTTEAGERYHALDPELLLWVWATLVDTALVCYERCFAPLSDGERQTYLDESKLVAYACGVPHGACPDSWSSFRDYFEDIVATRLRATSAGLAVARATMRPPLPQPLGALAGAPLRLVTAGLLPEALRAQFGFAWGERHQRRFDSLFAVARATLAVTPRSARTAPARWLVRRDKPLQVGWLQRRGAQLAARPAGR